MNRRTIRFGAILCLVAILSFLAWPFWHWQKNKAVSAKLYERTRAAVEKNPRLQPAWEIALQDGVLTWPEVKVILDSAGEHAEPEE